MSKKNQFNLFNIFDSKNLGKVSIENDMFSFSIGKEGISASYNTKEERERRKIRREVLGELAEKQLLNSQSSSDETSEKQVVTTEESKEKDDFEKTKEFLNQSYYDSEDDDIDDEIDKDFIDVDFDEE